LLRSVRDADSIGVGSKSCESSHQDEHSGVSNMSMSTTAGVAGVPSGFLDLRRIVAHTGYNRWLVPPAALAIHLCIGMAYGFSVFWLPLSQAIGVGAPVACPAGSGLVNALFTTSCDWKVADLGWMYTLFFVFLGSAAAIWGGWLERSGPRKAGFVAAICWCGSSITSRFASPVHQAGDRTHACK